MKYSATYTPICQYRDKPDAACARRCRRCNKRLPFGSSDLCPECQDDRTLARLEFSSRVANHLRGSATGPRALASGLNALRCGTIAGLPVEEIITPLLNADEPFDASGFEADLRAALRGMKATEGGAQ